MNLSFDLPNSKKTSAIFPPCCCINKSVCWSWWPLEKSYCISEFLNLMTVALSEGQRSIIEQSQAEHVTVGFVVVPGLEFSWWKCVNTGWSMIRIPGRRYQDLKKLVLCSRHQCQHIVIPVGGQPARTLKQTFPTNSFDTEISDKQKIESLICPIMRDHLVISKSWLKGCAMNARPHHESKEGYLRCADRSSQTQCDFTVINSDSFIFSHLAVSHQNSLARSLWKVTIPCVWRSQLPACECSCKASLDVPLSSLLLWRGLKLPVWNDIWSD